MGGRDVGQLVTLDDFNYHNHQDFTGSDGQRRAKGLVGTKRGYRSANVESFPLPLIDESEIEDRIRQQEKDQNSLQHLRDCMGPGGTRIKSTDQGNRGYCWFHSGTSAMLLARAAANQVHVDLAPYMGACIIKNYRDQGGNGDEGLDFIAEVGICTSAFWPQRSVSRSNDTPEMRADAKLHRAQKWYALDTNDRQTLKRQMATCYLLNMPTVNDYNRWTHSVGGARLVSWKPFKHRIWNSWSDEWSDDGMGDLDGDGWLPDDCWALVSETASEH